MKVTYYAELIKGAVRYFKENRSVFGDFIARLEIEKWEYDWATAR